MRSHMIGQVVNKPSVYSDDLKHFTWKFCNKAVSECTWIVANNSSLHRIMTKCSTKLIQGVGLWGLQLTDWVIILQAAFIFCSKYVLF